jgi:hypothetical protein
MAVGRSSPVSGVFGTKKKRLRTAKFEDAVAFNVAIIDLRRRSVKHFFAHP